MQELNHAQTQDVTGALRSKRITTLAIGEEGGTVTTLALGEEGSPPVDLASTTTSALGSF